MTRPQLLQWPVASGRWPPASVRRRLEVADGVGVDGDLASVSPVRPNTGTAATGVFGAVRPVGLRERLYG